MTNNGVMKTLADISRVHAANHPEKTAMRFAGRDISYGALDVSASRVANALLLNGFARQDRIAFVGKNSDRYYELALGVAKAGGVLTALNWRLAPRELATVIEDTAPAMLFAEPEFAPLVEKALAAASVSAPLVLISGEREGWQQFEGWWRDAGADDPMVDVFPDDVALQMYTSGTTGRPKGVQITHRNLLMSAEFEKAVGGWVAWDEDEVHGVYAPVYHVTGTAWGLMGLRAGARLAIIADFDLDRILDAIEQEGITRTLFVPAMFLMLLHHPRAATADFSSLKLVFYGASPIPMDLLKKSLALMKCDFVQVYGMTETAGAATYLPPEDHSVEGSPKMLSCGKPWPGVEIEIRDTAGNALPAGEVGEIALRTPSLMRGYWRRPEATSEVVCDGWYLTGDAGYLDADGYLYIHDRVRDLIITGGENVYPAEVENAIHEHPAVVDVGVIGIPSEEWGEEIKAFVMAMPGSGLTEDDIIEFARQRIAHYKCPRSVEFVGALPRNATGKILKTELRAPYWQGRERKIG